MFIVYEGRILENVYTKSKKTRQNKKTLHAFAVLWGLCARRDWELLGVVLSDKSWPKKKKKAST